jgi:hypothetical protein
VILTVQELIVDAMSLIGATGIDENPTSSELALGLRTANMMVQRWSSLPCMIRATDTVQFTTTAGKAKYTISEWGADINSCKPIKVFGAYLRDQSNIDYALEIIDKGFYDTLQDKVVSASRPSMLAYDAVRTQQDTPYGEIYLYNTPDTTYIVVVDCSREMSSFENLTDTVDFEPLYYEALKYGIAVRLFRHYHAVTVPIPVDMLKHENDTVKALYALNSKTPLAFTDLPASHAGYNIYTDQG